MKSTLAKYSVCIPVVLAVVYSISDWHKHGDAQFWATIVLRNLLVYACGWQLVGGAIAHLFFGDQVAEYIGWSKGHPFQLEVGFADLGMGILGVLCGRFGGTFWLATILMVTIFGWGCAVGHARQMVNGRNFRPGNAGYFFYWDILLPVALIALGIVHLNHGGR
ncbi:MAG: DUF6790 family protein [Verrucomicrobiia bacterium]|jgi:hypothetical protein